MEIVWKILDRVATVAVICISMAVGWKLLASEPPAPTFQARPSGFSDTTGQLPIELAQVHRTLGSDDAKIVLVEFSDFHCPFCQRHATGTHKRLMENYVLTGKVKYVFVHFPLDNLHPTAGRAAEAADCAGSQGRFWDMHERLFASGGGRSDEQLFRIATDLGIRTPAFDECMKGAMRDVVATGRRVGEALGIQSTPSFLLGTVQSNGRVEVAKRVSGAVSFEVFDEAMKSMAERARD